MRTVTLPGYPGGPFLLAAAETLAVVSQDPLVGVVAELTADTLGLPVIGVTAYDLAELPYDTEGVALCPRSCYLATHGVLVRCTRPAGHAGAHADADLVGFTW